MLMNKKLNPSQIGEIAAEPLDHRPGFQALMAAKRLAAGKCKSIRDKRKAMQQLESESTESERKGPSVLGLLAAKKLVRAKKDAVRIGLF